MRSPRLPHAFPFRSAFSSFLREYAGCYTYWYVPKARVLNRENAQATRAILELISKEFLGKQWGAKLQTQLLDKLKKEGLLRPYKEKQKEADRNALVRIVKNLLSFLGFLWVKEDAEIFITDAGLDLLTAPDLREVIQLQIAKYQYPNPDMRRSYVQHFHGILPHVFLLQVLQTVGYRLNSEELELFVNLAQSHEDLERVVRYIKAWRDLSDNERALLIEKTKKIPFRGTKVQRYARIHKNASYQRGFHTYCNYLRQDGGAIVCASEEATNQAVAEWLQSLKVVTFESKEEWFAYYGDPEERPSWFTFLSHAVEEASTISDADKVLEEHAGQFEELSDHQKEQVKRQQIEKHIETFYVQNLDEVEKGLRLVPDGRQYATVIGKMDLLCQSPDEQYVVVEIKADEADDATFGQILRYIGWIHRNLKAGANNVRGIIVAAEFPERARYSRIGLLRDDYRQFLQFKRHGLNLETI